MDLGETQGPTDTTPEESTEDTLMGTSASEQCQTTRAKKSRARTQIAIRQPGRGVLGIQAGF